MCSWAVCQHMKDAFTQVRSCLMACSCFCATWELRISMILSAELTAIWATLAFDLCNNKVISTLGQDDANSLPCQLKHQ